MTTDLLIEKFESGPKWWTDRLTLPSLQPFCNHGSKKKSWSSNPALLSHLHTPVQSQSRPLYARLYLKVIKTGSVKIQQAHSLKHTEAIKGTHRCDGTLYKVVCEAFYMTLLCTRNANQLVNSFSSFQSWSWQCWYVPPAAAHLIALPQQPDVCLS